MTLRIFIPGVPRNANARGEAKYNRWDKAKFRKKAKEIGNEIMAEDYWEPPAFTRITARQVSPVRRRRDPTGLAERLKGILDGLVDAKVLPDDDEDHISLHLAHSIIGKPAGIELFLDPEEP